MAKVLVSIECDSSEAVALQRVLGASARGGALALARLCRGVATGTKKASVSLVPAAPPAPSKRRRKAVEK